MPSVWVGGVLIQWARLASEQRVGATRQCLAIEPDITNPTLLATSSISHNDDSRSASVGYIGFPTSVKELNIVVDALPGHK